MITVVNRYKHLPTSSDAYIGRGSPLGNPYSHLPSSKAEYIVPTREEAVRLYTQWITDHRATPAVNDEFERLKHIHMTTGQLNLVCFCAPAKCHGEILKIILEEELSGQR